MADAQDDHGGLPEAQHTGLTRRGLLKRQAAVGAGLVAANALLGGSLADAAAASGGVTIQPLFYPLSSFTPEVDLRGKVAVITGASTGNGRAAGEALAARGVHVIGTSRDVASVRHPPKFTLLDLDISETKSIDSFMKRLRRHLGAGGRVDILINNAGRGIVGDVLPPAGRERRYFEQLQLGIRTDYSGHLVMSTKMLPMLPAGGYARVYFTVSCDGYTLNSRGLTYLHAYAAMKRALLASANSWWATLRQAHSHIGVATVNPYIVNTRFPDNLILTEEPRKGSAVAKVVQGMHQVWRKGLPAGMVGKAYWQMLSTNDPPVNVAVGSAAEPYATMGAINGINAEILAENSEAAIRFAC